MGNIDKSKLTEAQIQKAMACSSVEELMKVAKEEGYELSDEELEAVSGGWAPYCDSYICYVM